MPVFKTLITKTQFHTLQKSVLSRGQTLRDDIQSMIDFGLDQYVTGQGNTNYLTQTLRTTMQIKALPTQAIKEYIKAHCNVKAEKLKDGELGFKRDKSITGFVVELPEVTWYDFEATKKAQATPCLKSIIQSKAMVTRFRKAIKEGHCDDVEYANKVIAAIEAIQVNVA